MQLQHHPAHTADKHLQTTPERERGAPFASHEHVPHNLQRMISRPTLTYADKLRER